MDNSSFLKCYFPENNWFKILFYLLLIVLTFACSESPDINNINTPASGIIHGKPFTCEKAEIKEGVSMFFRGEIRGGSSTYEKGEKKAYILVLQNADYEIKIFLPSEDSVIPEGKTYGVSYYSTPSFLPFSFSMGPVVKVNGKALQENQVPSVTLSPKGGNGTSKSESFKNYNMLLEFGKEYDKKLPGKIDIRLTDKHKSHVRGKFEAYIGIFRLIEGEPDLTVDFFETLKYIRQNYMG